MTHKHAAALYAVLVGAVVCVAMRPEDVAPAHLPGYPHVMAGDEVVLSVEPYDAAKDVRPVHVALHKPVGPSGPVDSGYRDYLWVESGTLGLVVRLVPPRDHATTVTGAEVFPNFEVSILEGPNSGVRGIVSLRNLKSLPLH